MRSERHRAGRPCCRCSPIGRLSAAWIRTRRIEHTAIGLADHSLAGRSLSEWSDAELQTYCDRYNVGWIVCWSPETVKRFQAWPLVEKITTIKDEKEGVLFKVAQANKLHTDGFGAVVAGGRGMYRARRRGAKGRPSPITVCIPGRIARDAQQRAGGAQRRP